MGQKQELTDLAVIKDKLVGFQVADELKINTKNYCQYLKDAFFNQRYNRKSGAF